MFTPAGIGANSVMKMLMFANTNLILTAAARKSIAEDVPCTRGDAHPMAWPPQGRAGLSNYSGPIICTASMP